MQHPYLTWKPGYESQLASMVIERKQAVDVVCQHILSAANWPRYLALEQRTSVPASFIAALDYRESDCDPHLGLGQGDPWNHVSTHVPAGCGPFSSWVDAGVFYIHYDHLDDNSAPWSLAYECWKGEIWNGIGYRYHGVPSPYLFGGTSIQRRGKFSSDGHWDANEMDQQLGIMPIIVRLGELRPELVLPFTSGLSVAPTFTGLAPPLWVQQTLNRLHLVPPELAPLREDANYGRRTREAVRAYQKLRGLDQDGLCGPLTAASLLREPGYG
jgi:lysozyme family protein